MSWLLYQLVYNPACLVVPGGSAWMGSCIAERGALPRPLLVADSRAVWSSVNQKKFSSSFPKKKFKISQNKKKIQNASFKTPIPPFPTNIDQIATHTHCRFLILSISNNDMTRKSPFAIQTAIQGIGGDPKSVKKLRSGDLLLETASALQTKSFLLAKTFLDCPLTASPHKSLNSSRGVISEPDLICTPEAEILEGFSGQGVIQAGYLNCKIRPYIPNPLRCFKCQRFGHSQTSCRGQLTCSRCASVGHSSTGCTLELKCFNCSQSHSSDSKLCPKWKIEKQIQEIKTNNNISYQEARKLIAPQFSQTYAQVAKPSIAASTTQTDENITKVKCPPLQILKPLLSVPHPNASPSITSNSTSSSTTQANLLPSASSIKPTTKIASRLPKPISSAVAPDNNLNTSVSSLSAETRTLIRSNKSAARAALSTEIHPLPESDPTASNGEHFTAPEVPQCAKRNSRNRKKRPKVQKLKSKWLHIDLGSQHLQS
ncbi:putative RNA-directed DNA polymerase from transposon BS [Trichonephila clavipes]|nr:putative RNA-directed DNA polymerase from transposon BS [Trichonephila clavipes]